MKPNRLPSQDSDFGLIAWLEETRVALPLKGVECHFEVDGAIACVEVDQVYHQNASRTLDCTYTFPLPAGAAVYRCELHVNGRVIRAKVEEREAAQRIYREQKAAGRRAALVETERENLFTLSLGNVQPGDVIVVRFGWFQMLDRTGSGFRLLVPTCPGVRYIPGKPLLRGLSGRGTVDDTDEVPDASRITPPRIDALHPDAAYFSVKGRLSSTEVRAATLSSPSHPVFVRVEESEVTIELASKGEVPDRDFVVAWMEPEAGELVSRSWHWTEGTETYALIQLRAPLEAKVAEGFEQDIYFLVDRSGSMEGAKWGRTCEALQAFVNLLGPESRVWITLFESSYRDFAEAPLPAPQVRADRGFQQIAAVGTGGGTELKPAVDHVMEKIAHHSHGRRATVVLITDGQVGNESGILHAFNRRPDLTVHTFGIDTAVNDAFLKALARQHHGGCWLQTPNDDIAGTIASLGDRLRRPVMTDLSVRGSWEPGRDHWPDLHAGELLALPVRGSGATSIEITGRLPDGHEHYVSLNQGLAGSEAIKLLWVQERISALLASNRQREAIALAVQHNLICEGTAFVAWDEVEQVAIAADILVQPSMEPHLAVMRFSESDFDELLDKMSARSTYGIRAESRHVREQTDFEKIQGASSAIRYEMNRAKLPEDTRCSLLRWLQVEPDFGVGPALKRHQALLATLQLIAELRREFCSPLLKGNGERRIQQALESSPAALIRWAEHFRPIFDEVRNLRCSLRESGAPDKVIEHLVAWLFEQETLERERLGRLRALAESVMRPPFSTGATARLWRTQLESTVGASSKAYAAAIRWLKDLEGMETPPGAVPCRPHPISAPQQGP
jgi:Ca-activated chloride channel family protein